MKDGLVTESAGFVGRESGSVVFAAAVEVLLFENGGLFARSPGCLLPGADDICTVGSMCNHRPGPTITVYGRCEAHARRAPAVPVFQS